ncbi:MAG: copper-binding protein [Candidatus Endonucleobacter bathymodioli]|uniref:Copper-binding protein n=1 Tax=Candidatus Endonucleibacter bathymodioli TaxID=539814 RepID=A0AA90ST16_9GAMM|nr:copper-binding protein [Candidatus Endonucleobacter bathymodioli]
MNSIGKTIYLGAIALFAISISHQSSSKSEMQHHNNKAKMHKHSNMSAVKDIGPVHGVLNKIMLDDKKVNMTHDAITDLKWPAMTMDLDVSDTVDLNVFSTNEKIMFYIKLGKDKVYRITKMMKAGKKKNHRKMKRYRKNSDHNQH